MTERKLLYGRPSDQQSSTINSMILVDSGLLNGESSDSASLSVAEYSLYLLMTGEVTSSSGAVRGYRTIQIFNTGTTFSRQNLAASTNTGVTITNDTTNLKITLSPSSTSYDVYYALYAVM